MVGRRDSWPYLHRSRSSPRMVVAAARAASTAILLPRSELWRERQSFVSSRDGAILYRSRRAPRLEVKVSQQRVRNVALAASLGHRVGCSGCSGCSGCWRAARKGLPHPAELSDGCPRVDLPWDFRTASRLYSSENFLLLAMTRLRAQYRPFWMYPRNQLRTQVPRQGVRGRHSLPRVSSTRVDCTCAR